MCFFKKNCNWEFPDASGSQQLIPWLANDGSNLFVSWFSPDEDEFCLDFGITKDEFSLFMSINLLYITGRRHCMIYLVLFLSLLHFPFKWSNKIMKIQIADPNFFWDWSVVVVVGIDVCVSLSFGSLFDPFCLYFPCWYSNLFYIKLMVIISTTTMACSSNMHIGLIKMICCFIVWNTILIFICAKKEMQERFMHVHSPNLFVCQHQHGFYQLIS